MTEMTSPARLNVVYAGQPVGLEAIREVLEGRADVVDVEETQEAVTHALGCADVYVASLKVKLDEAMIASAPRLRLVVSATTGSDHVDLVALNHAGIRFECLREDREFLRSITPTAELAFLHMLAAARRLREAIAQPLVGEWNSQAVAGLTLHGRVLGVIGLGRLGTWVSRYGLAFGMRVIGTDPHASSWPEHVERVGLPDLLRQADFVTIHVHLSPETKRLLGAGELSQMKRGAILVNTSRGAIVDESAVIAALETGHLSAYGCDVLEGETEGAIGTHRLVEYARRNPNVMITPHIGGVSPDALRRTAAFTAQKILTHFGFS